MQMMLCAVLLAATTAAGFWIGGAYRAREHLLAKLVREVHLLEEQVRLGRPLEQALQAEQLTILSALSPALEQQDLAGAWERACGAATGREWLAAAEAPERKAMTQFFAELGMLDSHSQFARFAELRHTLAELHRQAADETVKRSRLYSSLGLLLGIAAVILLA